MGRGVVDFVGDGDGYGEFSVVSFFFLVLRDTDVGWGVEHISERPTASFGLR